MLSCNIQDGLWYPIYTVVLLVVSSRPFELHLCYQTCRQLCAIRVRVLCHCRQRIFFITSNIMSSGPARNLISEDRKKKKSLGKLSCSYTFTNANEHAHAYHDLYVLSVVWN